MNVSSVAALTSLIAAALGCNIEVTTRVAAAAIRAGRLSLRLSSGLGAGSWFWSMALSCSTCSATCCMRTSAIACKRHARHPQAQPNTIRVTPVLGLQHKVEQAVC